MGMYMCAYVHGCRCVVCKLVTLHNLSVTWILMMQTIFINRNQIISNGFTPTLVLINVFLKTQCWPINPSSWLIYPEDWPFQPAVVYPCKNSRKSVYLLLICAITSLYGHFRRQVAHHQSMQNLGTSGSDLQTALRKSGRFSPVVLYAITVYLAVTK